MRGPARSPSATSAISRGPGTTSAACVPSPIGSGPAWSSTRPTRFLRGNVNYDQALVGFEWADRPTARYSPNDSMLVKEYDTTVPGKSNRGHTFGADLCPDTSGLDPISNRQEIETRLLGSRIGALLAYLKTL